MKGSIIAAMLSALLSPVVHAEGSPTGRPLPLVSVVEVKEAQTRARIELLGLLKANRSVEIGSRVNARIERMAFREGERVAAGALLVQLDDRVERARVREAEAELADQRRQLANNQRLFERKALSRTDLDAASAQVAKAEAKLEAARAELDYLSLRAPFAGVVGFSDYQAGALVQADTVLTTLDDLGTMKLDLQVPEKYYARLKPGSRFEATSEAWPGERFTATLTGVNTRLDPETLSATARLTLSNGDHRLRPGMLMRLAVTLPAGTHPLIPSQALLYSGAERYVYVYDGEKVSRRAVEVGENLGEQVSVVAGLKAGEKVVEKGTVKLHDGARVEVR